MLSDISEGKRLFINSLAKLSASNRPILACYLPVGDPAIAFDQPALYAACGVDIFEVGVPCNNPFMDGPVISRSMQRVLVAGITQAEICNSIVNLRGIYGDIGIVVVGYENMQVVDLMVNGSASFDGILRIGAALNTDESDVGWPSQQRVVDHICFVPYAMSSEDIARACVARGYIMLQASAGKTGVRGCVDESNREKIERLKQVGVKIPILLGFGISTAGQAAAAVEMGADGVIIGSACLLHAEEGEESLRGFLQDVREAMNAVTE